MIFQSCSLSICILWSLYSVGYVASLSQKSSLLVIRVKNGAACGAIWAVYFNWMSMIVTNKFVSTTGSSDSYISCYKGWIYYHFPSEFLFVRPMPNVKKMDNNKKQNYLFIFFKIVERWKERSNWIVANKNIKNISFILFRWRASKLASGQETTHNHSLSHTNTLSSFIRSTSLSLSLTQVYFSIPT